MKRLYIVLVILFMFTAWCIELYFIYFQGPRMGSEQEIFTWYIAAPVVGFFILLALGFLAYKKLIKTRDKGGKK